MDRGVVTREVVVLHVGVNGGRGIVGVMCTALRRERDDAGHTTDVAHLLLREPGGFDVSGLPLCRQAPRLLDVEPEHLGIILVEARCVYLCHGQQPAEDHCKELLLCIDLHEDTGLPGGTCVCRRRPLSRLLPLVACDVGMILTIGSASKNEVGSIIV